MGAKKGQVPIFASPTSIRQWPHPFPVVETVGLPRAHLHGKGHSDLFLKNPNLYSFTRNKKIAKFVIVGTVTKIILFSAPKARVNFT